jgi:predicted amidohydrolase YtcJ
MHILYEGVPIYTMDDRQPVVEAMVVSEGRVAAIGRREELYARYPAARRIGLTGGAATPAFNDCHCHLLSLGLDLAKADLRNCRSVADIQQVLREWMNANPDALWIIGRAYDQNRLQEARHITRQELDAVSSEKPIYLSHVSKHGAAANTAALKKAGVTSETPDPGDGVIIRNEKGEPTGILLESATSLVSRHIPKPDESKMADAILEAAHHLARRGILAASDASTGWLDLEAETRAYAKALERGAPVRMTLMTLYDAAKRVGWLNPSSGTQNSQLGDLLFDPQSAIHNPQLRLGSIKLFADGALTTRTAAMREPYMDTPTTGVLMYEPEELIERIRTVHLSARQCAVHAIGDRAIELVLEGYRRAQVEMPREDARHRIEHAMLMADDLLQQMVELNIIAVPQPEFLWWLGPAYLTGLGERATNLMPYKTWLKSGVAVAFSSDQPVVPGDPIIGWRAAVDRKNGQGEAMGADECLDPLTALRLFTVGAAYATFDPDIGTLTPGKRADFIILSHRPEQILEKEMKVVGISCYLEQS